MILSPSASILCCHSLCAFFVSSASFLSVTADNCSPLSQSPADESCQRWSEQTWAEGKVQPSSLHDLRGDDWLTVTAWQMQIDSVLVAHKVNFRVHIVVKSNKHDVKYEPARHIDQIFIRLLFFHSLFFIFEMAKVVGMPRYNTNTCHIFN